jgi:hypothetical protein
MPPAWHRAPEITPPARLPGCTGKRIFLDRQAAQRTAGKLGHKSVYHCRHCLRWHTSAHGPKPWRKQA